MYDNNSSNSMSVAALVFGILSLICAFTGLGGIIFGAFSIIMAMLSRNSRKFHTFSKIGIGLSLAGIILGISLLAVTFQSSRLSFSQIIGEENESIPDNDQNEDIYGSFPFEFYYYMNPGDNFQNQPYNNIPYEQSPSTQNI